MNKTKLMRIGVDLVLIILGIIFLVFGIKDAIKQVKVTKTETPDNIKIAREYTNLSTDNVFLYLNGSNKLKEGNHIVILASKNDPYAQVLMPVLNEIGKSYNINIYYEHASIEMERYNENNKKIIYHRPEVAIFENESSIIDLKREDLYDFNYDGILIEYWTEERINNLKSTLDPYIKEITNKN